MSLHKILLELRQHLGASGQDGLVVPPDQLGQAAAPVLILLAGHPGPHIPHQQVHQGPEQQEVDMDCHQQPLQHSHPLLRPLLGGEQQQGQGGEVQGPVCLGGLVNLLPRSSFQPGLDVVCLPGARPGGVDHIQGYVGQKVQIGLWTSSPPPDSTEKLRSWAKLKMSSLMSCTVDW